MDLDAVIRRIPDHPRPGIMFFDLTTLFADPAAFRFAADRLAEAAAPLCPDVILVAEARGFVCGAVLAYRLGAAFVPARKPHKLPGPTIGVEYSLEYGVDELHVHRGAIRPGQRVLIHDDLLATGGTAVAKRELAERAGGIPVGFSFIVELDFLGGRARLAPLPVQSLVHYSSEAA